MKKITVFKLLIISGLFFLIFPNIVISAPERRTALVIGNSNYSSAPLRNPVNDASDIASILRGLGFHVTLKTNATQRTMERAILTFGKELMDGGVGLFYYAGHGMQISGRNYLIPVDAMVESPSDIKYEAVDAGRVLGKMEDAGNEMNIVILDACRDNPFARSFRSAQSGLARMDAPKGSLIAYSTSPGNVALDGDGRNSPYTEALLKNIQLPSVTVEKVFKQTRRDLDILTGGIQTPWESTSLTGDFYFNTGRGIAVLSSLKANNFDESLAKQRERLRQEREEFERQKIELEREKLKAERKRIEEEKKKYASISPADKKPKFIGRDGPYTAYNNGTIMDKRSGLMWATKDNGKDIDWYEAKKYCDIYQGGGYTDWRMPTIEELAMLFEPAASNKTPPSIGNCGGGCRINNLFHITCSKVWSSTTASSFFNQKYYFSYYFGKRGKQTKWYGPDKRVFPVRVNR